MEEMMTNRIGIRDGLTGAAQTLLGEAERMEDRENAANLRLMIPRLRQGLVRTAVIGATSSGKSTLINGLLEQIVVPENPNVSSPIPVWIGYADCDPVFTVYRSGDDGFTEAAEYPGEVFLKEYCYNITSVYNRDIDRFQNVKYGSVSLRGDVLRGGAVLIDTLGISASSLDTAKTDAVLEEGVDLVLFVSSNGSGNNEYTREEIDFLRTNVMGLNPDKRQVFHPVPPENVLFIHNDTGMSGHPMRQAMEANLDKVLEGFPQDVVNRVKENNIFYVQALMGRYLSCGAYPYVQNAPAGCLEQELEGLEERECWELENMSVLDRGELAEKSGMEALRRGFAAHVDRLCRGDGSAALHRIQELRQMADHVQLAASARLSDVTRESNALSNLRSACQEQTSIMENQKKSIQTAMDQYEREFMQGLGEIYQGTVEIMKNQINGRVVTQLDAPEEFDIRWKDFRKWSESEKRDYILKRQFLPSLTGEIVKICKDEIARTLDHAGGDKAPMNVLERSRKYIENQGKRLNQQIETFRTQGGDTLGVLLPVPETVFALCDGLRAALVKELKGAMSNSLSTAGERFEERIGEYVIKINWSGLFYFLPHGREAFWNKVKEKLLLPLVDVLLQELAHISDPGAGGTASALNQAVSLAYRETGQALQNSWTSVLTAVQFHISDVDRRLEEGRKLSNQEREKFRGVKDSCEAVRKQLDRMLDELLA